jgi:expansin (peptidoglycan-binding protein)
MAPIRTLAALLLGTAVSLSCGGDGGGPGDAEDAEDGATDDAAPEAVDAVDAPEAVDADDAADDADLGDVVEAAEAADAGREDDVAPPDGDEATACVPEPEHSGEATYYVEADGSGNCSFDPTPDDLLVGAMNHTDYADAAACGTCAHIVGPRGEVTVRIVDRCPECAPGDIDLSPEAFDRIAERAAGRVPITWRYVPCDVAGPIRYRFQPDSSRWWVAVQIRDHRYAIATLEARIDDTWAVLSRETWNYFVFPAGDRPGPYDFRVTDVHGHVLEDDGIPLTPGAGTAGAAQFPSCP